MIATHDAAANQREDSVLARCRVGDLDAYGQVYAEHERHVFRYAYHLLGSPDDADDINQETFDDYPATHGTSIASLLGGGTAGVAKGVRLHAVKVIQGDNNSYVTAVVKGFDWVIRNHQKPAVINASLWFRKRGSAWFGLVRGTVPVEKAVRRAIRADITCVLIAGNANDNANKYSPG